MIIVLNIKVLFVVKIFQAEKKRENKEGKKMQHNIKVNPFFLTS